MSIDEICIRDTIIEVAQLMRQHHVGDLVTHEIITARDSDGLWDTTRQMHSKGVRRMPVVNSRGVLVGIITLDDLLELLSEELAARAKIPVRSQDRERRQRH